MTQKNNENIYKALKEEERTLSEKKFCMDEKSLQKKRKLCSSWKHGW